VCGWQPITPSKLHFLRFKAQMCNLTKQKTDACLETVSTHFIPTSMTEIEIFIQNLSSQKVVNATNLYQGESRESLIRKGNLGLYLSKMKELNPSVLILGEAPGYKGCRLTGLPFTSEKIINQTSFFSKQDYKFINNENNLEGEISATIVWTEILKYKTQPLIWNIFPFHPFQNFKEKSNRTPTLMELGIGKLFLKDLLNIFEIKKILALGRKSESQILDLNVKYKYIRHPANGGQNEFAKGLKKEIKNKKL
jgi:uracil-DNA glycosylase